jgi:sn-glycerol 3-phosphate transport system ATP-binding protein
MAEVIIDKVTKSFGGMTVIHEVDCRIADGEFIVILGPSGCGKSTLLRIVAGLETASGGRIMIGNRVVNDVEPKDRNIAMVFQNYALYPHMSVFDNMAYGLRVRGMAGNEIDQRVRKAAEILNLAALLERQPRQLSGGQRQRVAMGRAIVREPHVFLFDEPLSNLDAKLRVQMRIEIKKLHQSIRTTSIYVTHDQVEAMTLAGRLIVMNAGRVEQIGAPMDVYARPATTFVAGFIGSPAMNLLKVRPGGDGRSIELPGGARVDLGRSVGGVLKQEVTVGVRPEHIETARPGRPSFRLDIDLVEALGADSLVHGRLDANGTGLTVRLPGSTQLAGERQLTLSVAPENLHLFDSESGVRLN